MDLRVTNWPIDKPIPYARNARKISPQAIDKVAASLKEFGFRQPIVVDKAGVIIVGHNRLLAAKQLGLREVPAPCHCPSTLVTRGTQRTPTLAGSFRNTTAGGVALPYRLGRRRRQVGGCHRSREWRESQDRSAMARALPRWRSAGTLGDCSRPGPEGHPRCATDQGSHRRHFADQTEREHALELPDYGGGAGNQQIQREQDLA